MDNWAIVPVKPFRLSKSRLAGVLSPEERAELSRGFLRHVLSVLSQAANVRQALVVSGDPAALELARAAGAVGVAETGAPNLNAGLERATQIAREGGAAAVLILPADLPLLRVEDVQALTASSGEGQTGQVVIAPDRHDAGTNALWVRPPGLFPYSFGPGSFDRHQALARQVGADVSICRRSALGLDVDEPADLELYRRTLATLIEPGLAPR